MSLQQKEELICKVTIPSLSLDYFVVPFFIALNLEFDKGVQSNT